MIKLLCIYLDETLSSCIFKTQITALLISIDYDFYIDCNNYDNMQLSVLNICNDIFTIFTDLITLVICESSYKNCVRLLFENPPNHSFRSSTLRILNIKLKCFNDCLYLLDGRFNQLHTLIVNFLDINPQDEIPNQVSSTKKSVLPNKKRNFVFQGDLPNLKCLSLSCYRCTFYYNESILPLLYRMSNLEQLSLYLQVSLDETFIDGNHLKENIINRLSRLNQFTFYICSAIFSFNQMYMPSTEDIQHTFIHFPVNQIVSYVDYLPKSVVGQCLIYSYPSLVESFGLITNNFPGGLFNNVRNVSLLDDYPFEHAFFTRIQKSFPFLERLRVSNNQSQNSKQSYQSNSNQNLDMIKYSFLNVLDMVSAHDDYIEQFLFHTKTDLQNSIVLYIKYKSLERVTHNFTRDITRRNCAKINSLCFMDEAKYSNSLQEYFPYAKIIL